ncbi:MAG: molybdopterin-dependent oxidoreductase [Clostridiales bacterium]|nr:molybdopterin-dependent oxidoreductase [Clostridiales bacterium]
MSKLRFITLTVALATLLSNSACAIGLPNMNALPKDSGDAAYEAYTIHIEGLRELEGGIAELSVAELRALPQHELAASYKRTTGLTEEFLMCGPLLYDVIALAGGNLDDYAGLGIVGRDNYYCLFSREVIASTTEMLLAVIIDGQTKLDGDNYPARAAVPGQFGPYWVKQVARLILYEEVPGKNITSVWLFANLTEGILPYDYEYYGSLDKAIDMEQMFSRLDYVDSRAFFTMKSVDGFKKNEAMNMVKSRYYLKITGADAPTNVAPYIKLGMNVQKIAWVSTNADAAIFPNMLLEYMESISIRGQSGLPLSEILYEVELDTVKGATFDLLGTAGERYRVCGAELANAILIPLPQGGGRVMWAEDSGYPDIENLLRIRLVIDE